MGTKEVKMHKKNNVIEISKKLISFYIVALFAVVWIGYYNLYAFHRKMVRRYFEYCYLLYYLFVFIKII